MSGDHNMNQTSLGWRKRQIALNKKADNARELGLNYEPNKTVVEMAFSAGLEHFEALVRADERDSWPAEMEAMERQVNILTDALAAEREECAKVCEDLDAWSMDDPGSTAAKAIRARGENT